MSHYIEITIDIGDCAYGASFYFNVHSDQWLIIFVDYYSTNCENNR